METLRESFRFHLEHGGYCSPPGRAACALQAARAELLLAQAVDAGRARVQWLDDEEPYWGGDAYTEEEVRAKFESGEWDGPYGCVVTVLGEDGADLHDVSCWGIVLAGGGHDPYRRVMEAELASEAADDIRAVLASGDHVEVYP